MSEVQQRDLYEVLRVRPDATQREIAQAYRSRIQVLGEVRRRQRSFLDETSREEQVALIQEAYETLFNKEKREAYDRFNDIRAEIKPLSSLRTPFGAQRAVSHSQEDSAEKKPRERHVIYEDFFGFSEKPFNLTPDPKYLYLSPKHKEALAHLVFGLQENSGFLKIIGEVGTGKTLICRSFLSQLHTDFNIAYIFNPCLNSLELLQSINSELGIPADSSSRKKLTDVLNEFLLEERKKGHRVVVVIDEAQDLDPRVLEQLRLLSNLETDTEKLIQIVLIGQPELDRLLGREMLRQLRQRITINWKLMPLNLEETRGYIQHRLNVALGKGKVKFQRSAVDMIFRYSQGIPRMINVLADRALLIAYTKNTKEIGSKIVHLAAKDVGGLSLPPSRFQSAWKMALPVLIFGGFWALAAYYAVIPDVDMDRGNAEDIQEFIQENPLDISYFGGLIPANSSEVSATVPGAVENVSQLPPRVNNAGRLEPFQMAARHPDSIVISKSEKLVTYLSSLSLMESKVEAAKWVLESWGLVPGNLAGLDDSVFEFLETDYQLRQYELSGNFKQLAALNYPAILELTLPNAQGTKYLALISLNDGIGVFGSVDRIEMPLDVVNPLWGHRAIILWKDFEALPEDFNKGFEGREVLWLQKNLRLLGFFKGLEAPVFGPNTLKAITSFQRHYGIKDDGNFYAESKMKMYNLLSIYNTPRLIDS